MIQSERVKMGKITVLISDETERALRLELVKRGRAGRKGALGEAIDEAIRIWVKEK